MPSSSLEFQSVVLKIEGGIYVRFTPTFHSNFDLQERYIEAIPLLERALSIRMLKLGGSNPDTVNTQNSLEFTREKVCVCVLIWMSIKQARSCARQRPQDLALLKIMRSVAGVDARTSQPRR